MKILYVTHKMMYPVTGGDCVRMSQMLDALAACGDVDVIYMTGNAGAATVKSHNPAIGREIAVCVSRLHRALGLVSMVSRRFPFLVSLYWSNAFRRRLISEAQGYDLVLLGGLAVAHYTFDLKAAGLAVALDLTDSPTMNLDNEAALSSGFKRLWHRLNARRMRRLETRWRAEVSSIAFISEVDRDYIDVDGGRQFIVCNKVDLSPDSDLCRHDNDSVILFVGNMGYAPNIVAVKRFATYVLPRIAAYAGKVRFRVVGSSPAPEIKKLAVGSENISVEGFVEDLSACYRSASIVVAPMFSGSGIQNKVLQAMAFGCCVVTTRIGAEGLDADSGAFVIAHDDEEMALACLKLLADPSLRHQYGQRARRYVAENFGDAIMKRQVKRFINPT